MLHIGPRPIIIRRIIAGLGLCLGLASMLDAAGEPPPAPSSFVLDDARLFNAGAVERMSLALLEMQRSTGVSVYVATWSYLETDGTRNRAQQLVKLWLNGKPGVILIFNRGNGQSGVVASPELWRRQPADETALLLADTSRALERAGATPERRIEDAVSLVVGRIRELEVKSGKPAAVFTGGERRLAILVAATIALSGLTVWLVSFARRKRAAARGGPFLFPDATVNRRLGGQFGGGIVGESSAPRPD